MADKLMYCTSPVMIHYITPSADLKQWLKRLNTHNELTNRKSRKLLSKPVKDVIIKLWGLA